MGAPAKLHDLVERFDRNIDAYESVEYNEMQARGNFIDPLMELLGWDVHNQQGKTPAYRDVIEEDRVKVGVVRRPLTTASTRAARAVSFWKPRSLPWISSGISHPQSS